MIELKERMKVRKAKSEAKKKGSQPISLSTIDIPEIQFAPDLLSTIQAASKPKPKKASVSFGNIEYSGYDKATLDADIARDQKNAAIAALNAKTAHDYLLGRGNASFVSDEEYAKWYPYLSDENKIAAEYKYNGKPGKTGVVSQEAEAAAQQRHAKAAFKNAQYQFAIAAQNGLMSSKKDLKQNEDARSDSQGEYNKEKAAKFVENQIKQNEDLQNYLQYNNISADDLLNQMESTYAEHINHGNTVTGIAHQNKARKEETERQQLKALTDDMHTAQNNFLAGAGNLAFGTPSNILWSSINNRLYAFNQATGSNLGGADHWIGMDELVSRGIGAPTYASDVVFKNGTSGNKFVDFLVDTAGDPWAWTGFAATRGAAKGANAGIRLVAPTAENLGKQTGRGLINETATKAMPTLAEGVVPKMSRSVTREAAQNSAKLQKALTNLKAAQKSGNKARIREAQQHYDRIMAAEKKTAIITSSTHPTATNMVTERGNYPRGQETHIDVTAKPGGMDYVPGQLETTVYPGIGTRLPSFDMQEYGAWPEYKRRKAPEFEQTIRYTRNWGDDCVTEAFRNPVLSTGADGNVYTTGPCGKKYLYSFDPNFKGNVHAVNPNIGVTGQATPATHYAFGDTFVNTHIPSEVYSLPINTLSERYAIPTNSDGSQNTPTYRFGMRKQGGILNYMDYIR